MIRQILANPTPVNIVVVVFSYLIIFLIKNFAKQKNVPRGTFYFNLN